MLPSDKEQLLGMCFEKNICIVFGFVMVLSIITCGFKTLCCVILLVVGMSN
jgi:hypothetical protein